MDDRKVNVLITIDTEFWPARFATAGPEVTRAVRRDYYGETSADARGVSFQLRAYERFGLRAVLFVEALHASACGTGALRALVEEVQAAGQEVQLHVHAEWVQACPFQGWPPFRGSGMTHYPQYEQEFLIRRALENLRVAGAACPLAFRGGNYGANNETLRALASVGIPFDTSHNANYLGRSCLIKAKEPLRQPRSLDGIVEFPIANFCDRPGHLRHAQINACSAEELRATLNQAWAGGWRYFVIVTHSNELLNGDRTRPSRAVTRRFEELCEFLALNRDRFRTVGFDAASG